MGRAAYYLYKQFGLSGAGLIFMLEGLGAPLPIEIPLGIIGLRMSQGINTYWQMVWLMFLTSVVGNTVGYLAGYYGGRPAIRKLLSWFRVSEETWQKIEGWFQKHGLKMVVATRWANWGFAQNMWLCGITRVPFGRFFTVMVVNDFFWAMGWVWLARTAMTYFRRHGMAVLHQSAVRVGLTALGVLVAAGLMFLAYRWWKRRPTKVS